MLPRWALVVGGILSLLLLALVLLRVPLRSHTPIADDALLNCSWVGGWGGREKFTIYRNGTIVDYAPVIHGDSAISFDLAASQYSEIQDRVDTIPLSKRSRIDRRMDRLISDAPSGSCTVHRDGDGYDLNTRLSLRELQEEYTLGMYAWT